MHGVSIELTEEQNNAYQGICSWIRNPDKQVISLGGLAGTGKTTLVNRIWSEFRAMSIITCAPTGKASDVLRNKGIINAQTIRKAFYKSIIEERAGVKYIVGATLREKGSLGAQLIICDEASMVGDKTFNEMKGFDIPVILVGDHGQLPPIKQAMSNQLVFNPTHRLETPLRQALTNPIIKIAHDVRRSSDVDFGSYGGTVQNVTTIDYSRIDQVICGTNKTRVWLNQEARKEKGLTGDPKVGDKVIAIETRKISGKTLRNGQQFVILNVVESPFDNGRVKLKLKGIENKTIYENVICETECFNNIEFQKNLKSEELGWKVESETIAMDYAYAITCHKSQGSEWDNVLVVIESWPFKRDEKIRWMYTAFTRAKETLDIFDMRGF